MSAARVGGAAPVKHTHAETHTGQKPGVANINKRTQTHTYTSLSTATNTFRQKQSHLKNPRTQLLGKTKLAKKLLKY